MVCIDPVLCGMEKRDQQSESKLFSKRKAVYIFWEKVPFLVEGELYFGTNFEFELLQEALKIMYNPKGNHFSKSV